MFDVKITQSAPIPLAGIMFTGPYNQVGKAFEQLNALAASRGLHGPDQRVIGIYYDDPDVIAEIDLRTFAGISIPENTDVEPPLEAAIIAGGRYAVFRYRGPYTGFEDCYEWIYGEWLKNCQFDLRDEPGFAQYLNPAHTTPSELLSDIYIPLQ